MNRFRAWYRTRGGSGRPLILAHRGDSFHAPENTMEAARRGLEAGADGWELDVCLTLDGHPVVIHDHSMLRTTDVARRFEGDPRALLGYPVEEFRLEEILSLDAGSWFVANSHEPRSARGFGTWDDLSDGERARFGSGSVRIPKLVEALDWTMETNWLVNVEIKPTLEGREVLVAAVLDAVESARAWDHVTISSFDHEVVAAVVRRESRVATGALISGPLDAPTAARLAERGVDAIHGPAWSADPSSRLPLLVYTINDSGPGGLAAQLASSGVTGLFTDDPEGMAECFGVSRS